MSDIDYDPESAEALAKDSAALTEAARILRTRFPTGKHDGTAQGCRSAAAELASRSVHPSRRPLPSQVKAADVIPLHGKGKGDGDSKTKETSL